MTLQELLTSGGSGLYLGSPLLYASVYGPNCLGLWNYKAFPEASA